MNLNELANCKRCTRPMPKRRKDGTGLLREFCSRRCAQSRSIKITINDEQASLPKAAKTSWWLDLAQDAFYDKARALFPTEPATSFRQNGWGS